MESLAQENGDQDTQTEHHMESAVAKEEPVHDQSESNFLALPAEIRNRIYCLCLLDEEDISINGLEPTSLLSSCRQIRNESLQIYYLGNRFLYSIHDCDATLYAKFVKNILRPTGIYDDPNWKGAIAELTGAGWSNLMTWCRSIWEDKQGGVEVSAEADDAEDGDNQDWFIIQTAVTIARESRALPWDAVERQLRPLGLLAERVDPRWNNKGSEK